MKKKLYFQDNVESEICHPIEWYLEYMKENELTEIKVFEARVERDTGYFYCKGVQEIGESNNACGKGCEYYQPRNGKNGICRHWGYLYEPTDVSKILRIKE